MSLKRLALGLIASLCAVAPPTRALAQAFCQAPALPPGPTAADAPADDRIQISAGRVELGADAGAEFSDQVEIRRGLRRLVAERASVDASGQRVVVEGTVRYEDPDVVVYGENARIDASTEEVTVDNAGFDVRARQARGEAAAVRIQGDRTVGLSDVSFTTCPPQQLDWELLARDIDFDLDAGVASARGVKLRFKGVPILYTPYLTFPLDDQRKSGFLTPRFADRDRTGLDLSIPYYINLAPNYDLTLEPRYLAKRGMQLNSDFRYLLPRSDGQLRFEYLPDDNEIERARSYVNLAHETLLSEEWQIVSAVEHVSDDQYFEDLGSGISVTAQTHLNRYVDVSYFRPDWSMHARLQDYQTIDPLIEDPSRPYRRVPQLLFQGRWLGDLFGFYSASELVNFERAVGVTGWRFDATEEVSARMVRPGMFLTPAIALRQTNYWLDEVQGDTSLSRTLPVASIDTGLVLEREIASGTRLQTLEPRLLYVYVPFEAQDDLPVFDTVEPDFNIVQLFRKYQFVGADRIADTRQLSFGLTTRIVDGRTGQERLTATFGQTRYLRAQRVSLPGQAPNDANASDYVAEMTVNLRDAWNLNVGYQWNTTTEQTSRAETHLQYRPREDRVFAAGYRFREGLLEQGDLSLVWPATQRWRFIGRFSYSFLEHAPLERFLGWEFEACCWRLRVIGRNFISRRTGESDNSILFQLELKGLSQRAASPEELLGRGILGYRHIGPVEPSL